MDFRTIQQTSETWCHSNGYVLLLSDEAERRLVFKHKSKEDITFFVICPESHAKKSWHAWSDNDSLLPLMSSTQDALSSCKERSLTEVLNMVHRDLNPVVGVGGAAAAAAAGSDTDEDFDFDGEHDEEDDYEDDPGYYQDEDVDAIGEHNGSAANDEPDSADSFFTGDGSSTAVHRLLADMKTFKKSEGKFGVTGGPRGDNLFLWDMKLTDFPKDSLLGKDLEKFAKANKREPVVYVEMKFPKDYPMAPPFVRVLRPRFKFLTGHVTVGGSICMEMLSKSGWRPTNDIESILVQIRAEIMSDENARLGPNSDQPYDEAEARHAFERMVKRYGWDK